MDVVELARSGTVDPLAWEYTVVDVETTGLDRDADRVCEIAAVRLRADGTLVEEFSTFVNPGRAVPNTQYHGIEDADVLSAPTFEDVAGSLADVIRGSVLVAHNLDHDAAFLEREYARIGVDVSALSGLCTLVTARAQLDRPSYRLPGLVNDLSGEWPQDERAALADARHTAALLTALLAGDRLRLTGVPAVDWPLLPAADRIKPRIFGLSEVRDGWLSALKACLPDTPRLAPHEPAASRYAAMLREVLVDDRMNEDDAVELGRLAGEAGLTRSAASAINEQVWHELATAPGTRKPAAQAVWLKRLAAEIGEPQLADRLPRPGSGLKGWRVLFVGEGTADLAEWAVEQGAAQAKTLTKTVRMVVVDDEAGADRRVAKAREAGVPVHDPETARQILAATVELALATATAPASTPEPAAAKTFTSFGDPLGMWWRRYELAGQLCQTFTRPVRWLAEQAADPAVEHIAYIGGAEPTVDVDMRKLPPYERDLVGQAADSLANDKRAGVSSAVLKAPRRSKAKGRTAKAVLVLVSLIGAAEAARWMLRG